jgi:hypothetical protein
MVGGPSPLGAAPFLRLAMVTRSEELTEADRIKEVIPLLNLALEDCYRFLGQAEEDVRQSRQESETPAS